MARSKVIISYSHADERWRKHVVAHLGVLEQAGVLELWDDRKVLPGEDRLGRMDREMLSARVAVLLLSADFLRSEFIVDREVPRLFERHEQAGMTMYPLLIRACSWKSVNWLARMQLRPKDAKPLSISRKPKVDQLLADVASEIAELARRSSIGTNTNPSAVASTALTRSIAARVFPGAASANAGSLVIEGGPTGRFVYCATCGVIPSAAPTKCPGGYGHTFITKEGRAAIYCATCGVVPSAAPTECSGGYGHTFLTRS